MSVWASQARCKVWPASRRTRTSPRLLPMAQYCPVLLIATPVMRVAVSIVAFLIERDWIFVIVTSFVLAMLILSFFLGKAEG